MLLRAIHFKPGVLVTIGGSYHSTSYWDLAKFPDVLVERQENGDYLLITSWDGRVRRVRADAIAWTLEEPDGVEEDKIRPALNKRDAARRAHQDKFGKRESGGKPEQRR